MATNTKNLPFKYEKSQFNIKTIQERELPTVDPTKEVMNLIKRMDKILSSLITQDMSFDELNEWVHSAAQTVIDFAEIDGIKVWKKLPTKFPNNKKLQQELLRKSPRMFRQLLLAQTPLDRDNALPFPSMEQFVTFWTNQWTFMQYDSNHLSQYIEQEHNRLKEVKFEGLAEITIQDLRRCLNGMKNSSNPGIDGVRVFWFKKFSSIQGVLVAKINELMKSPANFPEFLTWGLTKLAPKSEEVDDPANYRPMTYLPVMYRIISKCIARKIVGHFEKNYILAYEQMGDLKGCQGYQKIHILDAKAMSNPNVFGVYIDYNKALDSISHEWVQKLLNIYKVPEQFTNYLSIAMDKFQTRLCFDNKLSDWITVKRGLLQGDPLSTVLYWTAVNPISFAIRGTGIGVDIGRKIILSHLLYMDDLRLYAASFEDLEQLFQMFLDFSEALSMVISLQKSYQFPTSNAKSLMEGLEIQKPGERKIYLGCVSSPKLEHKESVHRKIHSFLQKVSRIRQTHLQNNQKRDCIKYFMDTGLLKTCGVLKWEVEDIYNLIMKLYLTGDIRLDTYLEFIRRVYLDH